MLILMNLETCAKMNVQIMVLHIFGAKSQLTPPVLGNAHFIT